MNTTYVQSVLDKIENKNARAEIGEELESHLLDKRDYYMELGYTEEEATRRAEEEMGDPDDCAVALNGLHRNRGKTPLRIAALIFLLAFLAAALFTPNIFSYGSEYLLGVFHRIGVDLLSTGFIAGFAAILITAQRKKDKITVTGVLVCLAAYFVISLINIGTQSLFGLFQPSIFGAFTLFTKGFGGYADRVFAYQYTPWEDKGVFVIGAAVIFAVLFLWAAALFLSIHFQERLRSVKPLHKALKGVQAAFGVLLCANLILMAAGTVTAAVDLPNKQAAAQEEKREIIDRVITSDTQQDFAQFENGGDYLPYYNIESNGIFQKMSYQREPATNNTIIQIGDQNHEIDTMASYGFSLTNFNTELTLLSQDIRISKDEARQVTGNISLDDFMKLNWYTKAVSVTRTQSIRSVSESGDPEIYENLSFNFLAEGNTARNYTFIKESGSDFILLTPYEED